MNRLPDSVPYNIKVSFLQYQRREWEKVIESSKNGPAEETRAEVEQHWINVNTYALAKLAEIDRQLEELKVTFTAGPAASAKADINPINEPSA
jgi:hypothetical protein